MVSLLFALSVAKSIVASWVLSPSSARKTVTKTVKNILGFIRTQFLKRFLAGINKKINYLVIIFIIDYLNLFFKQFMGSLE